MSEDEQSQPVTGNGSTTPFGSLVANVGGRIQELLDSAEQAATKIQADAEAAGTNYLRDRQREADRIVQERMAELDAITQSLAARTGSMEREMTAFVAEVEQVRWRMARLIGDDGPASEPAPSDQAAAFGEPPPGSGRAIPQAAALRATQMAVAGAERVEIERMLRDQFGMDDPSAIDRVLQNGSS